MQHDHVHLIAEAESTRALARGMAGLCIRFARRLNKALGRRGKVFAARYHATPVTSPKQARAAIAYVLCNNRHHAAQRGPLVDRGPITLDPCSSAASFDGWRRDRQVAPVPSWRPRVDELVMPASCWLLKEGWRRHGLIGPEEIPGPAVRRR
jgi:hypothetical protein